MLDINQAIIQVLKADVQLVAPDVSQEDIFPEADLVFDLGMDSIQLMQMLVQLEMQFSLHIPGEALSAADITTIEALADVIDKAQRSMTAKPGNNDQTLNKTQVKENLETPELDIKVHCLVSCLCEPFRLNTDIDHRPFYFAVPDAEVFMDKNGELTYHDDNVNHQFFINWFEKLYQTKIDTWYQHNLNKNDNVKTLVHLLDSRQSDENILVMLDLFHLPERENKFNKDPFPHYVCLEKTDNPNTLFMWDPDFRWEGELNKAKVLNAVAQESVGGGYRYFSNQLKPPKPNLINDYFYACININKNEMTSIVRQVIDTHLIEKTFDAQNLNKALRELPVLAIRKYGYEHALAFFWRELKLEDAIFEEWCDVIEKLVRNYERLQLLVGKYLKEPSSQYFDDIYSLLDEQDDLEFQIKKELHHHIKSWQKHNSKLTKTCLETA